MQGERLELHCCEVDTPPLSLVLFINLFHPRRASSDPHSSRGEGGCLSSIIDAAASHEPHSPEPSLWRSHKGQKTTGRHLASHPHSWAEENYAPAPLDLEINLDAEVSSHAVSFSRGVSAAASARFLRKHVVRGLLPPPPCCITAVRVDLF